jgi:hypothetical protein
MSNEYYLVPFGREPGGYLDVLGLPPNASKSAASNRSREFIQNEKNEAKKRYKALAAKQEKNEITKEECEAEKGRIEAALNKRLAELNKLKEPYDAAVSQAKKLKEGGYEAEPTGWVEMSNSLDGDPYKLWGLLSKRRPLPRVSEDFLLQVEQRWVNTGEARASRRGSAPGFLDVLALPADASQAAVASRFHQYRQNEKRELEAQFKMLEMKLKKKDFNKEEHNAEIERLTASYDKRMADLSELKDSYAAAQERRQKRQPVHGAEKFQDGNEDEERSSLSAQGVEDFPDLPSSQAAHSPPTDLAAVSRLIIERDLIGLLWADKLWARLSGTNRDYWQRQLQAWLSEIEQIGPHFRRHAENGAVQSNYDYPHLCEPRKLTIEHLEEGPAEDTSQDFGRRRPDSEQMFDLQKFLEDLEPAELAKFLASLGGGGDDSSSNDARRPASGRKRDSR